MGVLKMRSRPGRADGRGRSDDAHPAPIDPAHGRKVEAAQGPYTIRHLYLVIVSNRTFASRRSFETVSILSRRTSLPEGRHVGEVPGLKPDGTSVPGARKSTWQNRSGTHSRRGKTEAGLTAVIRDRECLQPDVAESTDCCPRVQWMPSSSSSSLSLGGPAPRRKSRSHSVSPTSSSPSSSPSSSSSSP